MATQMSERSMEAEVHVGRQRAARVVRGGSWVQVVGGIGTGALAILGLLGVVPMTLWPIAAVTLGAAYLVESGFFASQFPRLFTHEDEPTEVAEVGSGVGGEFAAGLGGIVLGILSLLTTGGLALILLPAAAIMYGAGVLMASMSAMRVRHLGLQATVAGVVGHDVRAEAVTFAAWFSALCGLGAILLGILALVLPGVAVGVPVTLGLIAFLALGCATVIGGTSVARQMVHLYQPAH